LIVECRTRQQRPVLTTFKHSQLLSVTRSIQQCLTVIKIPPPAQVAMLPAFCVTDKVPIVET